MKKVLVLFGLSVLLASCNSGSSDATFRMYGAPTLADAAKIATVGYGSPNYLTVKLYTVWLSTNADCSAPIVLQDYGTAGQTFNMFESPELGSGSPAAGTYNCMIVKQSDTSQFRPEISHNGCVAGLTYTYDIARTAAEGTDQWVDIDMRPITTTAGDDVVYIFATMDKDAVVVRGASTQQVINLTSPFVSPGKAILVLDFTDQVTELDYGGCWLDPADVSFIAD